MALAAGRPVDAPAGGIAADSLAPKRIGELVFPIARRYVAAAVLVEDDAIAAAQRALWETARIVAEPGAAAPLAALLSKAYVPATGERVGILVSGANTTAVAFVLLPLPTLQWGEGRGEGQPQYPALCSRPSPCPSPRCPPFFPFQR